MRRIVLATIAPLVLLATSAAAAPAESDGRVCPPFDTGRVNTSGEPATVTVTAPEGYALGTICIKAGSAQQGNGPELYTAGPGATTLTLGHSSGKAVSHWSASFVPLTAPIVPGEEPGDDPGPGEDPGPGGGSTGDETGGGTVVPEETVVVDECFTQIAPAEVPPAPADAVAPAAAPVAQAPAFTG